MITTYFLNCISEDIYKHQEDQKVPGNYYVGLSSSAPSIDGTGVTEPRASEYARVKIDNRTDFREVDEYGIVSNSKRFNFPESQVHWGTLTYYVIFDEPIGGNLLMFGKLSAPVTIPIKTIVSIPEGTLKISTKNA